MICVGGGYEAIWTKNRQYNNTSVREAQVAMTEGKYGGKMNLFRHVLSSGTPFSSPEPRHDLEAFGSQAGKEQ